MNTNDEDVAIPPEYYSISEILAIFNTMIDTTFSIFTSVFRYGCIRIQFPYTIHFTNARHNWEICWLGGRTVILCASFYGSNVIDITRNRQVIQVYSFLVWSSNLKIVIQNNSLLTIMIIDDPTIKYYRSIENIWIPMMHRFDRLVSVFMDLDGNIKRLNNEFEIQLTIEDRVEGEGKGTPTLISANQLVL